MTAENKEQGYELYRAISDVDERYVTEMLDDSIAEDIRTANRRKRITMRSTLTAVAAVFVLVIGIGILPNLRGIQKSDDAVMKQNAAEDAEQYDGITTTKGLEGGIEEDDGAFTASGNTSDIAGEEDEMTDDYAFADEIAGAEADTNDKKSAERNYADDADDANNKDGEDAAQSVYFYEKLQLDDASIVTVLSGVLDDSVVDRPYSRKTADGVVFYEVKGISCDTCLAVYYPDEEIYRLALCSDYAPEDLTDEKIDEIISELQLGEYVTF